MANRPKKGTPPDAVTEVQDSIAETVEGLTDFFTAPVGQRKPWAQLSPDYRRRLERGGITEREHARGQGLHKARGHVSVGRESDRARYRRDVGRFVDHISDAYGRDPGDVREALAGYSEAEIRDAMAAQRDMENLYDAGLRGEATALWNTRDRKFPDWMYFYHGSFS